MEQDTNFNVHDISWHFSVTDPRLHTRGFTVYKVSCKSFNVTTPELLTEIVCWKRYNDFKALKESLMALHKVHHKSDQFPELAKPKIFGRFSETVIEKRRQSASELLNFISTQPHLYKSSVFTNFLEEGSIQSDFNKKGSLMVPRSSNLSIISSGLKADVKSQPDTVEAYPSLDIHGELKSEASSIPVVNTKCESQEHTSDFISGKCPPRTCGSEWTLLEGTWNFPQVADSISLGSSIGDETIDTDDETLLTASLPEADLACLGTSGHTSSLAVSDNSSRSISSNTSWVTEGLNVCALMGSDPEYHLHQGKIEGEPPPMYIPAEFPNDNLETNIGSESPVKLEAPLLINADPIPAASNKGQDLEEFDSLRRVSHSSGSSKTECGKGDLDLSVELQRTSSFISDVLTSSCGSQDLSIDQTEDKQHFSPAFKSSFITSCSSPNIGSDPSQDHENLMNRKSTQSHTPKSLLKKLISGKPPLQRPRSVTEQSVSTMSLNGKDDYIYRAANQICKAQNCEVNGDYEVAFAYYKSGVGILLHGVQGDTNKYRRDAVRRKTAKYLMKAEDLFNRYLAHDSAGELRWGTDSFLSPSMDPSFAFIRGSTKELRNFQVLGIIDKVILVRHKDTDETFVIKSISKSTLDTGSSILPTSCPCMVSLHRFFETEDSVFLLLQYASGGKLWTYIGDYLNSDKNSQKKQSVDNDAISSGCRNIYYEIKSVTATEHEKPEQFNVKILDILGREKSKSSRDFDQNSEGNVEKLTQSLKNDSKSEFPVQNKEKNKPLLTDKLTNRSMLKDSFHVINREDIDPTSQGQNVPNYGVLVNSNNTLLVNRSSLSITNDFLDDSVISPTSLPEKDSFQSLVQNYPANHQTLMISSDANVDFQQKSSPLNIEGNNVADLSASSQAGADRQFSHTKSETFSLSHDVQTNIKEDLTFLESSRLASTFNSDDIIRKSKELLTQVDKVLAETNGDSEEVCNKLNEDHSNISYNCSKEHIKCGSRPSQIRESDSPVFKPFSQSKIRTQYPYFNSNSNSLFRQTCTPRKLSMTRSASFEYDTKSPARRRARTLPSMLERYGSRNMVPVRIPESFIKKWIAQMVTAISRLHSLGVICRDLKPSNVLLGDGGQVLLTYFCNLGHSDRSLDWEAKEHLYAAPEVGSVNKYNRSCDWWSVGALLYELVVGQSLSDSHPGGINSHTCLHIPTFVPQETRALLEGLLRYNPNERLGSGMAGSEEIKAHPFFTGVDWHSLEYS